MRGIYGGGKLEIAFQFKYLKYLAIQIMVSIFTTKQVVTNTNSSYTRDPRYF